MRPRAYVLVAAVSLAAVLVMSGAVGLVPDESPGSDDVVGASDAAALAQAGAGDLGRTVELLQDHLREQPQDARSWATLGLAYVEQARVTADPTYYPRAEGALGRSVELQPDDNSLALAGQAALAAARHDFAGALRLSRASLAINPYEVGALSVRVDALTELGRYDAAMAALAQADRRRPSMQVFARYSYAEELHGHTARAVVLLQRALDGASSPADRAYLLSLLADLERRDGRLAQAGAHLREALRLDPGHVPALVSAARLAVARGDVDGAVRRWLGVVEVAPFPGHLLELGELYEATGRPAQAADQYRVLEATMQLLRDSGVSTDLEIARYLADHGNPRTALAAARSAWEQAPSIWSADALAWALHVVGRDREALARSRSATRLGTPDAMLWVHRGSIEAALGRDAAASAHLRAGLGDDPGLNVWQADRARALLRRMEGSR